MGTTTSGGSSSSNSTEGCSSEEDDGERDSSENPAGEQRDVLLDKSDQTRDERKRTRRRRHLAQAGVAMFLFGGTGAVVAVRYHYISSSGTCPYSSNTGYTCHLFACGDKLGMATCSPWYRCVCQPGFCNQGGVCQLNTSYLSAGIAAVNRTHPTFPGNHANVRTALCVSGGGSRSLTLTLGALRALEHLDLMSNVDAISSVSGGSWASAVYMFANQSKKELLGDYSKPWDPESLTMKRLQEELPTLGKAGTGSMYGFLHDLALTSKSETMWIRYVGRQILAPAGLDHPEAFMAPSQEVVDKIRALNPVMRKAKFVVPQPGRPPVFVMNAAILAPEHYRADMNNVVSFQASPDWTGSPFHPDGGFVAYESHYLYGEDAITRWVGGGFVETFAFGGPNPPQPKEAGVVGRVKTPSPKEPFSLQDAIGISSAAFGKQFQDLTSYHVKIDPMVDYWPVSPDEQDASYYTFGDGGNIENSGLLAMLQRGANRIVWLINTDVGVSVEEPFCATTPDNTTFDPLGLVTDQVTDKFGFGKNTQSTWLSKNQVFEKDKLIPLLCTVQTLKKAGKPSVVRQKLRVLSNSWWGIQGGFDAEVVFVFNEVCKDFQESLPADTKSSLESGEGGKFNHFPFYKTTLQNPPEFTSLTLEQVHLLAAQSEYALLQNADTLRDVLRPRG